jgi:hypothetical protein
LCGCVLTASFIHQFLAGLLEDKRRYQAWLRSRRAEVEAGHGLTADIFKKAAAAAAAAASGSGRDNSSNSSGANGSTKKRS